MNKKARVISHAKQNGFVYPKAQVIFCFAITGGAIGGFLLWLILFGGLLIDTLMISFDKMVSILSMVILFVFFGAIIGGIPACLTGIYLVMREFVIVDVMDYGWLFLIGALMTALCGFVLLELTGDGFLLMTTGGLSAMICGKWFVPKL